MQRSRAWLTQCIVLLDLTFAAAAIAQTNTFPTNGNVGIGTTSPSFTLEINGVAQIDNGNSLGLSSAVNCASGGATCSFMKALGNSTNSGHIELQGFYAGIGFNVPLSLNPIGGSVGIGTTAPGADLSSLPSPPASGTPILEVNGDIALTQGRGGQIYYSDGTVQSTAWNGSLCGGDYAESVDVSGERTTYEPGDVIVIDPNVSGHFLKSSEPYSAFTAGIYSTKPGVLGRRQTTDLAKSTSEIPMAMVGIVPTKVSTENGPIKRGDMLVTSSTPGYAMKGTDRSLMLGAVIGKAIDNLESGTGVIEVLVSLQ